tara:strand:- start:485 stop:4009 length:3525 start_codon:yes stop_codon:yes gene_type:complete
VDEDNSYYGTGVVSQLTDANTGAMTWGTPVVFTSETTGLTSQNVAYDSNTSRSLVVWKGSDNVGHAKVATVTAGTNSVAFGAEATFNSDGTSSISVVEDPSTDRMLVVFADNGDSEKGKATVGTITGGTTNTVAFGAQATFESGSANTTAVAYSPDLTKSLIVWGHKQDKLGEAVVATVTGGTTNTVAFGSPATFSAAGTKGANDSINYAGCAYDTVGDRFVIVFNDPGDSQHTKIIGCTVSGTTPSFGSSVKLQADGAGQEQVCIADPSGEAVYVAYSNAGASDRGYVHRITGTGTTVTDSTTLNFSGTDVSARIAGAYDPDMERATLFIRDAGNDLNSLTLQPYDGGNPMSYHIAYDPDNNYVLNFYSDGTKIYVRAISHNTSDGTYTAVGAKASPATFNMVSNTADIVYDPDTNRGVIAYKDTSNSNRVTANVVQTGGTAAAPTVTLGADSVIETDAADKVTMTYDTTNNKVFVVYDNTTDGKVRGSIGTVNSGTNAITFAGTADVWDYSSGGDHFDIEFDAVGERVVFFYRDDDNSDYLTYKNITPGASSFTVASGAVIGSTSSIATYINSGSASFGDSKGCLIAFRNAGDSNKIYYGTTRFPLSSNLDNGNYLGIAAESISDTSTGKINIPGGVNENQSSLTIGNHYFTNGNGVVGLVGSTTGEQYLGKAIAADKIQLLENEGYAYGTAEGAVTAGKPIFVESDGDFFTPTSTTTTTTYSAGTRTEIIAGTINTVVANDFDVSAERFVVSYLDGANSNRTSVKLVSVASDKAISVTATQELDTVNNGMENAQVIYDPNAEKTLIVYQDGGNSSDLRCRVLTIGASSVTVGSEVTIDDSNNTGSDINLCYDTTNNKIIVYTRDQSNSNYPTVYVGSISGTTPSFGAAQVVISEGVTNLLDCSFGGDKFIFTYDDSDYDGSGKAGSLSGTTMSFGNEFEFETNNPDNFNRMAVSACYDSVNDRFVQFFKHSGAGDPLNAKCIRVHDDNSTTIGTELLIGNNSNDNAGTLRKSNLGVVPVCYRQSTDIYYTEVTVDPSDNSLTKITGVLIGENISGMQSALAHDTANTRLLNVFEDHSQDDLDGIGIIPNSTITTTTFPTSGKGFVGFATKDVSDNGQVEVATAGQIDAQQSGLTAGETYYAQSDGTLGTSADSNGSVIAGRALSATKLLIT